MGFEDEAEQSFGRPCRQSHGRSKRTCELTSSIVPRGTSFRRSVELEFSPIEFDPERFSCCCRGLFSGPAELGAVNPYAMHDHGELASQATIAFFIPRLLGWVVGSRPRRCSPPMDTRPRIRRRPICCSRKHKDNSHFLRLSSSSRRIKLSNLATVHTERLSPVSDQVHEHGRAGILSVSERLKRRAADLYGAPVLIDRTPGCHEAGTSMKAWTATGLKADYERKTVAGRVPYLQIHETDDAAELHDASDVGPLSEGDSASLSRKMQRC